MQTKEIFDTTIQVLDKVLELRSQKLQSISSNIANAETPGYARQKWNLKSNCARQSLAQARQLLIQGICLTPLDSRLDLSRQIFTEKKTRAELVMGIV
jgi:flagellar basal-body rod protein FlgB